METPSQSEYMLIFRGTDWQRGLSPEQMQQVAGAWMNWFKTMHEKGLVTAGSPLESTGKIVSGKNGRVIADGPFAESKEAIGGYFMLRVNSIDEAVAIAQQCPGLPYGIQVEVRPIAGECSMLKEAAEQKQLAHA